MDTIFFQVLLSILLSLIFPITSTSTMFIEADILLLFYLNDFFFFFNTHFFSFSLLVPSHPFQWLQLVFDWNTLWLFLLILIGKNIQLIRIYWKKLKLLFQFFSRTNIFIDFGSSNYVKIEGYSRILDELGSSN